MFAVRVDSSIFFVRLNFPSRNASHTVWVVAMLQVCHLVDSAVQLLASEGGELEEVRLLLPVTCWSSQSPDMLQLSVVCCYERQYGSVNLYKLMSTTSTSLPTPFSFT